MGDFCGRAEASSFTAVLDFTWGGWSGVETKAKNAGFPYIRYGQFVLCCLTPPAFSNGHETKRRCKQSNIRKAR